MFLPTFHIYLLGSLAEKAYRVFMFVLQPNILVCYLKIVSWVQNIDEFNKHTNI